MLVVTVVFEPKPEHAQAFRAAMSDNARTSRESEPGCRQFDVCRDPADPALFYLYELYDDEAAIQAHLRSPHFLQMDAVTAGWVDSKRVRKLRRTPP